MRILSFQNFVLREKKLSIKTWTIADYTNSILNVPIVRASVMEGKDYKKMITIFAKLLSEKLNIQNREDLPSKQEIKDAFNQLKSVPKVLPIVALLSIPLPFLIESYALLAYIIWKLSGEEVNILPKHFTMVMEDIGNKKIALQGFAKQTTNKLFKRSVILHLLYLLIALIQIDTTFNYLC